VCCTAGGVRWLLCTYQTGKEHLTTFRSGMHSAQFTQRLEQGQLMGKYGLFELQGLYSTLVQYCTSPVVYMVMLVV
jgi:hypothetical protein